MEKLVTLNAYRSDKIWGYEDWQFSTHPNGMTTLQATKQPLLDYLAKPLPILIKYLVANETLSVQVHPNDAYAKRHTTDLGKTECWYITKTQPGAQLICGLHADCDADILKSALLNNTLTDQLTYIDVAPGDMIYIPAGTVHAIMGGIELIEIQQSSDTTYRLYDWGRDREMHIEESLAVIDYQNLAGAGKISAVDFQQLVTPYFTVKKQLLEACNTHYFQQNTTFTLITGTCTLDDGTAQYSMQQNETLLIHHGSTITLHGQATYLLTTW